MTPHLVKWHNNYRDRGLRVIEINNGQMDSLADIEEHATEKALPFPILHDERGEVTQRFKVRAYPTAYLIDRDGNVVWEGHPADAVSLEQEIELALGA